MVNKGSTKGFELALFMAYGMFSITNTIHLCFAIAFNPIARKL